MSTEMDLLRLINYPTWMTQATCRAIASKDPSDPEYVDPDYFYPESDDPEHKRKIREARAICGICPVAEQCIEYALRNREIYGIWGAKTRRQRDRIRRERIGQAN